MGDASTEEAAALASAPSTPTTFREVPWTLSDVLIGLAIPAAYLGIIFLPREVLQTLPRTLLWLSLPVLLIWLLFYPLWSARRRCPDLTLHLPKSGELLREAAWSLPLLLGFWAFLTAVWLLWSLVASTETPDVWGGFARAVPSVVFWVLLIASFTLGPIAEEVFFRGFLYNALRRCTSPVVAATLQAALFGMLHPYNRWYAFATALIGLYFVAVYEWRRSLLAPIFLHQLHNALFALAALVNLFLVDPPPVLGVAGVPHSPGMRVTFIGPGTGAEKAGIKLGDIITAIDGQTVSEVKDLARMISERSAGDVVHVELLRDGEALTVQAVLGPRPEK